MIHIPTYQCTSCTWTGTIPKVKYIESESAGVKHTVATVICPECRKKVMEIVA